MNQNKQNDRVDALSRKVNNFGNSMLETVRNSLYGLKSLIMEFARYTLLSQRSP